MWRIIVGVVHQYASVYFSVAFRSFFVDGYGGVLLNK